MKALLFWLRQYIESISFLLAVTSVVVAGMSRSWGAEPAKGTLESYLEHLGYVGIDFKPNAANQPLIGGELGGKKLVFLVDTGWGFTSLDTATARGCKTLGQLGVTLEDQAFGVLTNISLVLIDKLVLGQAEFFNQPARAQPLQMDSVAVEHAGILGLDFFERNFCLIDCRARRLFVRGGRPSHEQAKALQESLHRCGFDEVPLRPKGGATIDARMNGHPVVLAVDTGATVSVLAESLIKPLNLVLFRQETPSTGSHIPDNVTGEVIGVGKIGAHKLRLVTVNLLEIGVRNWANVHFGVANLKDWGISKPGSPGADIEGLFGAEMLAGHGALIDFAGGKLWLSPARKVR